jgi:transposase
MHKNVIAQIRKATCRKYSAKEKIRIVLDGLRGEIPISGSFRREGIVPTMYYRWSKTFLEAGKNGLTLETLRDATSEEVRGLKEENASLKKALAEAILDVMRYKKASGCRQAAVCPDEHRQEVGDSTCRRRFRGAGGRGPGPPGDVPFDQLPMPATVPGLCISSPQVVKHEIYATA